jgi:predicted nucleic acid-binding Zn ribbon protein
MERSSHRQKRCPQPKPIGGVIDRVVQSLGISRSYYGWMVVWQWPEIVGEQIAARAKATRFEDGVVYVVVPDASWRHHLSLETEAILKKIHSLSYGRSVSQLRLVSGEKG